MARYLLQVERCTIDPEHRDVIERWLRTARRLGREDTPPTWARRVWTHVATTDVDGRPLGVDTSWSVEFGTGHPPVFPAPKFPVDIVDRFPNPNTRSDSL
jgi:hypothetical protein